MAWVCKYDSVRCQLVISVGTDAAQLPLLSLANAPSLPLHHSHQPSSYSRGNGPGCPLYAPSWGNWRWNCPLFPPAAAQSRTNSGHKSPFLFKPNLPAAFCSIQPRELQLERNYLDRSERAASNPNISSWKLYRVSSLKCQKLFKIICSQNILTIIDDNNSSKSHVHLPWKLN